MASTLVMRSLLAARNPLEDAKDTLSSWDKCMAKDYCKSVNILKPDLARLGG